MLAVDANETTAQTPVLPARAGEEGLALPTSDETLAKSVLFFPKRRAK